MNKEELYDKLVEVVKGQIYHENYDRTVELAKLYSQLISGKDSDELLEQFVRREDDDMFTQRKTLTQQITSSISNGPIKTFNKVFRTNPSTEIVDFNKKSETGVLAVTEVLREIYGGKDVYKYLQDKFMYYTWCDPNAFIYTTFDSFDAKSEKPQPYNREIASWQAMNYEYFNNVLQWLVSRDPITYIQNDSEQEGAIYTMYGPEWGFTLTQVGSDYEAQIGEEIVVLEVDPEDRNKDMYFIKAEYQHKSKVIPVIQVGYERDYETKGETFVSPIEPGVPYLMKLIKSVSEFDLTMCLHAFPQKFEYIESCTFDIGGNIPCKTSGQPQKDCKLCGGKGYKVHTTAQDAKLFKMPKTPEEMFSLKEMIHYEQPPIDILEFQSKTIKEWKQDVTTAIFNSETFSKDTVNQFATGLAIDEQKVYDTLKPFAEKVSDIWCHMVKVISYYLDFSDPIPDHAYPNDFKFKTTEQLLEELNKATTGGASGHIIAAIEDDIIARKYIDNQDEQRKYLARQRFAPFKGKTRDEIQQIILSGEVRKRDVILYNYFEPIFSELEDESEVWFYDLAIEKQKELLDAKIKIYQAEIEAQQAVQLKPEPIDEPIEE